MQNASYLSFIVLQQPTTFVVLFKMPHTYASLRPSYYCNLLPFVVLCQFPPTYASLRPSYYCNLLHFVMLCKMRPTYASPRPSYYYYNLLTFVVLCQFPHTYVFRLTFRYTLICSNHRWYYLLYNLGFRKILIVLWLCSVVSEGPRNWLEEVSNQDFLKFHLSHAHWNLTLKQLLCHNCVGLFHRTD